MHIDYDDMNAIGENSYDENGYKEQHNIRASLFMHLNKQLERFRNGVLKMGGDIEKFCFEYFDIIMHIIYKT